MSASKLVKPSLEYRDSYLEALDLYHKEGRDKHLHHDAIAAQFENYVKELNKRKSVNYRNYPDWVEIVPDTILWLVKNEEYLGSIKIRHRLNWHLKKWGGNVSFIVRPDKRLMGYGQKMFRKALPCLHVLDVNPALMTVTPDNKIARHIIEKFGAVFEDELPETDSFPHVLRYWLKV
ncbi:MAG: GNAT family N-acetyltransferase [Rhodospirillales bacterium]|nr:GNAT family N-acetyltransferase [Rhodospirillales bacterium]MCB9980448.1 GNAT family N-acetyltransferase [Rhodospirillales bacterium]